VLLATTMGWGMPASSSVSLLCAERAASFGAVVVLLSFQTSFFPVRRRCCFVFFDRLRLYFSDSAFLVLLFPNRSLTLRLRRLHFVVTFPSRGLCGAYRWTIASGPLVSKKGGKLVELKCISPLLTGRHHKGVLVSIFVLIV
jgi:hypothetical protein